MTDFCCLTAIVFALVFGSLILAFAAAHVAGIESERERERQWQEFSRQAQERALLHCAAFGHDWIDAPLLSVHNRCRRCGEERGE